MSTFKFNFVEDEDDAGGNPQPEEQTANESATPRDDAPFRELTLDELISSLPPALSYSPFHFKFPLPKHPDIINLPPEERCENVHAGDERTWHRTDLTLVRRDLFDARFQLIAQERDDKSLEGTTTTLDASSVQSDAHANPSQPSTSRELNFLDNPSDLLPGVYEGGLKTWECSLDLVEYLECAVTRACGGPEWVRSTRIVEIGCGTAIPTMYLLHELFSHPWKKETPEHEGGPLETIIYLQDFNSLVLELVTFPNILLTWYISPLASEYRKANPSDSGEFNVDEPGEVEVTPALIDAFRAALQEENVKLQIFSGSWSSLLKEPTLLDDHFDVILTSETIYNLKSLPTLVELVQRAYLGKVLYDAHRARTSPGSKTDDLEALTESLSLDSRPRRFGWPICVVAAKILYFGVGGGISDYERAIQDQGGRLTTVMERKAGVGRKLMQTDWPTQ